MPEWTRSDDESLRLKPVSAVLQERLLQQFHLMLWKLSCSVQKRLLHSSADTHEDLYQEGAIALLEAAERYDPDRPAQRTGKPVKFITFAHRWVHGKIKSAARRRCSLVRVPEHAAQTGSLFYADCNRALNVKSLARIKEDHNSALMRTQAKGMDFDERQLLEQGLRLLPDRERQILSCLYGLNGQKRESTTEIARFYPMSRQAIHAIGRRALRLLRQSFFSLATPVQGATTNVPRSICPACQKPRVLVSRGICTMCHRKPEVRNQYPRPLPWSRANRRETA